MTVIIKIQNHLDIKLKQKVEILFKKLMLVIYIFIMKKDKLFCH